MKIIHTSDWHLGQSFYDYDRYPEHTDMLRQITEIVRSEQPDALLLSGDVFHTGNPSPAAVKMYNSALLEMHSACPTMSIVITAGNHDSASRLVVNNDLWDHFRVTVLGTVAKNNDERRTPDFDTHIIRVDGADGKGAGFIAAVPHCYESNFPTLDPSLQREQRARDYFRCLLDEIRQRNTDNLPVVLMAHMAVEGCDFAGHDNIGGMETRDVDILGSGYDYVALGHIHTPQNITDRVRYCGTPVPVNFGERFEHSVSVVTIEHGAIPVIETRRIRNLIPLHDFPSEPAPFSEVIEGIRDYNPDELCYLRLLIKTDSSMTPLANVLVAEAVKDKKCRICKIQVFNDPATERTTSRHTALTTGQLREKTPIEIAELFFDMMGLEMTDTQRDLIRQASITANLISKGDSNEA